MVPLSLEQLLQLAAESESNNDPLKTEEYFQEAVSLAIKNEDPLQLQQAYRQFAAFLRRQKREDEAITLEKIAEVCSNRRIDH
ncbi:MAG: hypothetical protein U0105_15690 [Candidatus Obscuribacterales bacterium]